MGGLAKSIKIPKSGRVSIPKLLKSDWDDLGYPHFRKPEILGGWNLPSMGFGLREQFNRKGCMVSWSNIFAQHFRSGTNKLFQCLAGITTWWWSMDDDIMSLHVTSLRGLNQAWTIELSAPGLGVEVPVVFGSFKSTFISWKVSSHNCISLQNRWNLSKYGLGIWNVGTPCLATLMIVDSLCESNIPDWEISDQNGGLNRKIICQWMLNYRRLSQFSWLISPFYYHHFW